MIGTKSIGNVTSKDTVSDEEEKVFTEIINKAGVKLTLFDRLEDAIEYSLGTTEKDDIVLLAGCQGMDHGAKVALDYIHEHNPSIEVKDLYKPLERRVAL